MFKGCTRKNIEQIRRTNRNILLEYQDHDNKKETDSKLHTFKNIQEASQEIEQEIYVSFSNLSFYYDYL